MEKPTIYCVQSGLGKTFFVQHHLGGADIDSAFLGCAEAGNNLTFTCMIDGYLKQGYKIVCSGDPYAIQALEETGKYNLILVIATEDMKQEVLTRVKTRNPEDPGSLLYPKQGDDYMRYYANCNCEKNYITFQSVFK